MTLQMSDYGFKIVKSGKSLDSTNPTDFIFNSKYPTLSIKKTGSVSLTTGVAGPGEPVLARETVAHNFGYKPQFMAFTSSYASQWLSKWLFNNMDYVNLDFVVDYADVGGNMHEDVCAYVTDTDLVVEATIYYWSPYFSGQQGVEWTYDVDYVLFMEEAI